MIACMLCISTLHCSCCMKDNMLRLHCINMHSLSLDLGDRDWDFVCMVCISFDIKVAHLVTWAIMHGNAGLVVQEPRNMSLWGITMIRDMAGAYMPWIVLPCLVLPSVAVSCRFCRNNLPTGSVRCRPAIFSLPTDSILCRWIHISAGGDSTQPVVLPSAQGCNPEVLTASRGVKEGKQRQLAHGGAYIEEFDYFS